MGECCTRLILYIGVYTNHQKLMDFLFVAEMLLEGVALVMVVHLLVVVVHLLVVLVQVGVWVEQEHPFQVPLEVLLVQVQDFGTSGKHMVVEVQQGLEEEVEVLEVEELECHMVYYLSS
jgi:hypothetical protein